MDAASLLTGIGIGVLLGAAIGFLYARNRLASAITDLTVRARAADERTRAAHEQAALVDGYLAERLQALSAQALHVTVTAVGTEEHPGQAVRPDMVIRLAGGKNIVVDSKVSLAAYLEAAEASDEQVRDARLAAHARHLKEHVDRLAAKAYWSALSP